MVSTMAANKQQQPAKTFPPPVSVDEMFPSEHIKCADLRGEPRTFTIDKVLKQEVVDLKSQDQDGGKQKMKARGVVRFKETDQTLVMNRTNATLLMTMFGNNPQLWAGKRVTLNPETTQFGRDTVPCIRIGGSPDIDRDMRAYVKMPRKTRPLEFVLRCTRQSAPVIADYEKCEDLLQFEGLETRRKDWWPKVPTTQKPALKEAAEACNKRLLEAQQAEQQRESAVDEWAEGDEPEDLESQAEGEQQPFDPVASLQQLATPADAAALEAAWAAACDYYGALNQEVPPDQEAAYIISKEQFA